MNEVSEAVTYPASVQSTEVRICPLGPPTTIRPVRFALCSECGCVRKSNQSCPMIAGGAAR